MTVVISMLRGVNVGGHNKIKMEALREVYTSMGLQDVRSYIQSGNLIFRTNERDLNLLAKEIRAGIEKSSGIHCEVVLRSAGELRDAIARNPFGKRREIEPRKLLVSFLASEPGAEARAALAKLKTEPEELRLDGREMYIYFPNGMARPKMSWAAVERTLKTPFTGRNWNSVTKLCKMAEELEERD